MCVAHHSSLQERRPERSADGLDYSSANVPCVSLVRTSLRREVGRFDGRLIRVNNKKAAHCKVGGFLLLPKNQIT
jgi:hypothetical protein